ncbi:MAG: hypothetical protein DWB56_14505 [Candidatus Jettenia sp.]|uniref:Uncharacterized protein n=2 Tax=Candidatus Jettenia TaxID=360731 RepID=I3IPC6_9BACT|nr:MAG: hypothetical protein EDM77_11870 [Candidatus Jettenia sp. AMX1]MBC6930144.1 hypothetical protein [Candidatus Jettenia sp.]MCE7881551.1 hypothetical protein [Candidatus Jettenia sp. AMX1]MCQ3927734.1 hypothetical protein [Candidatus Jettenia sp.]GAB63571.1 hypothetical protein KSU1_D0262 [Candidatus Jettenia caeni]
MYFNNMLMNIFHKTYRFKGKVLPDGHLSIPDELATSAVGKEFEVVMTSIDDIQHSVSLYLDGKLKKKGKLKDLILDSASIEEAVKTTFGSTDISNVIEIVRK